MSYRPHLESGALRQMHGLPEHAFDMLVTLLARICDVTAGLLADDSNTARWVIPGVAWTTALGISTGGCKLSSAPPVQGRAQSFLSNAHGCNSLVVRRRGVGCRLRLARCAERADAFECAAQSVLLGLQVIAGLQVQPEPLGGAEVP